MMTIEELNAGNYNKEILKKALNLEGEEQEALFLLAREKRKEAFGEGNIEVRSVIEVSNICSQKCNYCSIGGAHQKYNYTLDKDVIVRLCSYLYDKGRRIILLQSGENKAESFVNLMTKSLEKIKTIHNDMEIILCMGDLSKEQYKRLFNAGAERYILKFEASNPRLFAHCKPNDNLQNRIKCMDALIDVGFKLGSGNIIGLPTQTIDDIVDDLLLIHKYPLSMNSTTTFIPAEYSAFANEPMGNVNITLNFMALMRIMNPTRKMPTTSSLEKAGKDGQYKGLMAGANTVTIHDGTPEELQQFFPIYSYHRYRPQIDHLKNILSRAALNAQL